jgi:hypothetical protein
MIPDYTPDYKIGLTSSGSGFMNLSALVVSGSTVSVSYPKSTFTPYSSEQQLVSGLVRGVGYPVATWNWGAITREERDALRSFCPHKSASVYIRTKTMDSADSYKSYSAVMVWDTDNEQRDTQRRLQFKITFQRMVGL